MKAGADLEVRNVGLQTLNSLRLEKAYRDFGIDLDNTDNPMEVRLGFAVRLDKPGGFIGRDASVRIKARRVPETRLLQFLLNEPQPLLYGNELICPGESEVGYLQVGGHGHTLGGAVGIGFVTLDRPISTDVVDAGR